MSSRIPSAPVLIRVQQSGRAKWSCYTCPKCGHQMEKRTGYDLEQRTTFNIPDSPQKIDSKKKKKKKKTAEEESGSNDNIITVSSVEESDSSRNKKKSKKRHHEYEMQDDDDLKKNSKMVKPLEAKVSDMDNNGQLNSHWIEDPSILETATISSEIEDGNVVNDECKKLPVTKSYPRGTLSCLQYISHETAENAQNVNKSIDGETTFTIANDSISSVAKKRRRRHRKRKRNSAENLTPELPSANNTKSTVQKNEWTEQNIALKRTLGQHVRFNSGDEEAQLPESGAVQYETEEMETKATEIQADIHDNTRTSRSFQIITPVSSHLHPPQPVAKESFYRSHSTPRPGETLMAHMNTAEATDMHVDEQDFLETSAGQKTEAFLSPADPIVLSASVKNGVQVYSRQRKKRRGQGYMREMSEEEQINSENTNVSFILKNTDTEDIPGCKTKEKESLNEVEESRRDVVEEKADVQVTATPLFKDYTSYPDLVHPPRVNDKLAFKMLELTEDYQPVLSDFKEGVVLNYDQNSQQIVLMLKKQRKEYRQRGKFDVTIRNEENETLLTNVPDANEIQLMLTEMQEVKLLT